jgi:hypothetical protein
MTSKGRRTPPSSSSKASGHDAPRHSSAQQRVPAPELWIKFSLSIFLQFPEFWSWQKLDLLFGLKEILTSFCDKERELEKERKATWPK